DNIMSVYGVTAQARISDPQDPSRIFTWLLEETLDDRGSVVLYEYKQEDRANIDPALPQEANRLANGQSSAARYLKRIRYANQNGRSPLISASGEDPANRPAIEAAIEAHRAADDFHFQVVFDYGEHNQSQPTPNDKNTTWPTRLDPFSRFRSGFDIRTY